MKPNLNLPDMNDYIKALEAEGQIDPKCNTCVDSFYPKLARGESMYDIFAPRHRALETCKSGKHPHCTCDTCF